MRITIVTGSLYPLPPVGIGAVEKRWYDCARYFAGKGHQVKMLACRGKGELSYEKVDGVEIYRSTNFTSSRKLMVNVFYEFLYSLWTLGRLPEADVTVVNSVWLPIFACLRKGKAGKIFYNLARYPKGHLWLYKHVDRISAGSRAVYNAAIEQTPAIKGKMTIIPNPINTEIFYKAIRQETEAEKIVIVYSGRIHPEKGIEILIDAAREIFRTNSEIILRLIGTWDIDKSGGGEKYAAELRERAGDLPIEFTGAISKPVDLAEELRAGHIYVYPSVADKGEAFGIAPLEAMALGLPVIVSELDCFKDFVEDGKTGLIFDHKSDKPSAKLAGCINRLLTDAALRAEIAGNAAEAAKRFSIDNIAEQYLAEFQSLCG